MISGKNSVFVEAVFGSLRQIIGYLLTFPVCRPDRTGVIASTLLRPACRDPLRGEARLSFAVCSAFRSRLLVRAEDRPVRALSLIRSLGRGVFIRSFSRQGKHRKESFVGTIAFARLRAAGFVTGRSVVTVRFRDSYSIGKQPAGCRRNNHVVWQRRSECETDFPIPV